MTHTHMHLQYVQHTHKYKYVYVIKLTYIPRDTRTLSLSALAIREIGTDVETNPRRKRLIQTEASTLATTSRPAKSLSSFGPLISCPTFLGCPPTTTAAAAAAAPPTTTIAATGNR